MPQKNSGPPIFTLANAKQEEAQTSILTMRKQNTPTAKIQVVPEGRKNRVKKENKVA